MRIPSEQLSKSDSNQFHLTPLPGLLSFLIRGIQLFLCSGCRASNSYLTAQLVSVLTPQPSGSHQLPAWRARFSQSWLSPHPTLKSFKFYNAEFRHQAQTPGWQWAPGGQTFALSQNKTPLTRGPGSALPPRGLQSTDQPSRTSADAGICQGPSDSHRHWGAVTCLPWTAGPDQKGPRPCRKHRRARGVSHTFQMHTFQEGRWDKHNHGASG